MLADLSSDAFKKVTERKSKIIRENRMLVLNAVSPNCQNWFLIGFELFAQGLSD
jgi:hypothetical protein